VNFALVGSFVLLLGAMLIGAVLWLAAGGALQRHDDPYEAIVEESVSGLNVNAPVKFNGVDVGRVREIRLDPVYSQRVRLTLAIERGTPIGSDTVAVLKTQGLTGIAYMELKKASEDVPAQAPGPPGAYPQIRTEPSLGVRLENVLGDALGKVESASDTINELLSEENRAAFKDLLDNVSTVMHTIAARKDSINAAIVSAAQMLDSGALAAARLDPVFEQLGNSARALEHMGTEVARTSARATAQIGPVLLRIADSARSLERMGDQVAGTTADAGSTLDEVGADLRRFTGQTVPELERLLGELSVLSASLRRLSEQTERDPAGLLFGRVHTPEGPGELRSQR